VTGNFLDHIRVVNERNHPHLFLADRTLERVDVPSLPNQVPPLPGREFAGRWRRAWGEEFEIEKVRLQMATGAGVTGSLPGATAHLVGALEKVCRVRKKAGRPLGRSRAARRTFVIVCWARVHRRFKRLRLR